MPDRGQDKQAKGGGHCIAHGGGYRCQTEGCDKHAMKGGHCIAHGGRGCRCQAEGCDKHALKGGHCIAHGGGRRCQTEGCDKRPGGGHVWLMEEVRDVRQRAVIRVLREEATV